MVLGTIAFWSDSSKCKEDSKRRTKAEEILNLVIERCIIINKFACQFLLLGVFVWLVGKYLTLRVLAWQMWRDLDVLDRSVWMNNKLV